MGYSTVPDDVQYITSTLLLEVPADSGKFLWYKTNVAAVLLHSFSHVIHCFHTFVGAYSQYSSISPFPTLDPNLVCKIGGYIIRRLQQCDN